jgi:hypothetical protein
LSEVRGLDAKIKSLSLVTDGSREAFDAYALYRRSFSEQGTQPDPPVPPHMEFLIDRQGLCARALDSARRRGLGQAGKSFSRRRSAEPRKAVRAGAG